MRRRQAAKSRQIGDRRIVGLGGKSITKLCTEVYLVFHLKIRVSHLWFQPYSTYQTFLFETITDFRQRGWNFKQIADWLNEQDYLTPQGKTFGASHAFSIIRKKRIRDARLGARHQPDICDFSLRFVDTTFITA